MSETTTENDIDNDNNDEKNNNNQRIQNNTTKMNLMSVRFVTFCCFLSIVGLIRFVSFVDLNGWTTTIEDIMNGQTTSKNDLSNTTGSQLDVVEEAMSHTTTISEQTSGQQQQASAPRDQNEEEKEQRQQNHNQNNGKWKGKKTKKNKKGGGGNWKQKGQQKEQRPVPKLLQKLWKQHYNETEGEAVKYARLHKIDYRYHGFPPSTLDIIDNPTCIDDTTRTWSLPYGLLIGVEKGGTTALAHYLHAHPDIVITRKELHVLDDDIDHAMLLQNITLSSNETIIVNNITITKEFVGGTVAGISRNRVQQLYKERVTKGKDGPYAQQVIQSLNISKNNNNGKYIIDMTPFYMFLSDRVPSRIVCVVPNAKVFAMLRNPIDRAMSHYEMIIGKKTIGNGIGKNNKILSFDEFIKADINALKETGVIQDWNKINFNTYTGSQQEFNSWRIYINSGVNTIVGMGLYSIQIQHLFNAFDKQNKSHSDFLAIRNEDLKTNTNETYLNVLDFLGLQRIPLDSYEMANTAEQRIEKKNIERSRLTMSNETRQLLIELYEPYNRQLTKILGNEWDGIWK